MTEIVDSKIYLSYTQGSMVNYLFQSQSPVQQGSFTGNAKKSFLLAAFYIKLLTLIDIFKILNFKNKMSTQCMDNTSNYCHQHIYIYEIHNHYYVAD